MRSEYLNPCTRIAGLAEAINQGLYLTPRLDTEQFRAAIEEPALICGGRVEPELVVKLLEDAEFNQDQLPLLQHVLMRLWDSAAKHSSKTLTSDAYSEIGGLENALDKHANIVYEGLTGDQQRIAEIIFRRLTESGDVKGDAKIDTRCPTQLTDLIKLTGASHAEVVAVIDTFRQPGCCFLMPPISIKLSKDSVIDISHESLIRQWKKLKDWVKDEAETAKTYRELVDASQKWKDDKKDFLKLRELYYFLKWYYRDKKSPVLRAKPTNSWAKRYGGDFGSAETFLLESDLLEKEGNEEEVEARRENYEATWK